MAAACSAYLAERGRAQDSGAAHRLQAQRLKQTSLRMADIKGREVCGSQELQQYGICMGLAPDALPSYNITLTLGNSRIYEPSLGNGSIFMGLQKPENLNQTKDSCNEYLHVKLFGQKKKKYIYLYIYIYCVCVTHCSMQCQYGSQSTRTRAQHRHTYTHHTYHTPHST